LSQKCTPGIEAGAMVVGLAFQAAAKAQLPGPTAFDHFHVT
jgi:hypothetical protein